MVHMKALVCLALMAGVAAVEVTPIEKVISLIEGLRDEVATDGKNEAQAYEEFACFCKKTTDEKSKSVQKGEKNINKLSASIEDKTASKEEDISELAQRKKDQEKLSRELEETNVRCAKAKAEYNAEAADLSKAIQGLEDAIKAMTSTGGTSKASLLAIQKVGSVLQLAEAMGKLKPKHQAVAALIQSGVDPDSPEYKYHSNDIIDVCDQLLVEYKATKKDLDTEWEKTRKGCTQMKASLAKKMATNKKNMNALDKEIKKLSKEIAEHREDLITAESTLKDDELYLKDLGARCEARANDYDQRSAMRGDELAALNGALKVLKGKVKGRADTVNVRAMLLQKEEPATAAAKPETVKAVVKPVSFLQEDLSNTEGRTFLSASSAAKKEGAIQVLRTEGKRLHSLVLASLAEKMAADPFEKVKGLIQKLIERLLAESAAEATKKGFCDTELAKARADRDARYSEARDLNAETEQLEAKRDELEAEIKELTKDIKEETKALKEETKEREDDKEANMKTMKTAKEGLEATNEALLILKSFYKQAAKAAFVQASPVDEDTDGAGFSGNYGGKQSGAKAVFALLETIAADFDRTLRKTEEAENAAHRDFVDFQQTSEASIAGKTTKKELDEQDLETTNTNIKSNMDDLQTAVDLMDKALETLEELKPTCIDTGMSYAERVEKREEEIKALNKAHDILLPQ